MAVCKHKKLIKALRKIGRQWGATPRFRYDLETSGYYDYSGYEIFVDYNVTARLLISAFFHELGHYVDHQEGKFKLYYLGSTPLYKLRKISLPAEIHADNTGWQLCRQYFKVRYQKSYRSKEERDFLQDYYGDRRCQRPNKK